MDNDSFNYNDWREQNLRPLEFWQSRLNEHHLRLLDELKKRFNDELDRFSENYREDIQIQIDLHVSNQAKLELLERAHAETVNSLNYLRYYRKVLNSMNLIDDEVYNEFIMSFGVVSLRDNEPIEENEVKALDYLEKVAMLNILERMIELVKEAIIYGNQRFKDIPLWQIVLSKLGNRFEYKKNKYPNVKYTIIKVYMNDKALLDGIDDLTYLDFVRKNFKDEMQGNKFSKLAQHITRNHDNYMNSVTELNEIYKSI